MRFSHNIAPHRRLRSSVRSQFRETDPEWVKSYPEPCSKEGAQPKLERLQRGLNEEDGPIRFLSREWLILLKLVVGESE